MAVITSSRDKRRFERVEFAGQAMIRTPKRPIFMACEPQNVSVGGVCVRMADDLDPQDEVDLQLVSPELPEPVTCHGRVNWTTARVDLQDEPHDIGIEFIGVSPQVRSLLEQLVRSFHVARGHHITEHRVSASCDAIELHLTLRPCATTDALLQALPVDTTAQRWGDELYCAIPITVSPEAPTQDVTVGDVAFWVEGQALCLFFGKTPMSVTEQPRPVVPVNLIGRFTLDERMRSIHAGAPMRVRCSNDA